MFIFNHRSLPIFFLLFLFISLCFARLPEDETTGAKPPDIGNFSVPPAQQPGPLLSFGQSLIPAKELQVFISGFQLGGTSSSLTETLPYFVYALTDNDAFSLQVPIINENTCGRFHSKGLGDLVTQFEHAFYNKATSTYYDSATIVGQAIFPTRPKREFPIIGLPSPSYFLGATYSRTTVNWYYFCSPGAVMTTTRDSFKYGNSYLYQFGFGKNMGYGENFIITWLIEVDGSYFQQNKLNGELFNNSGGNLIYLTPSIFASTKYLTFQVGVGHSILQNLYGQQSNPTYLAIAQLALTIY